MSTSYPSNLSDGSGSICNAICLSSPSVADHQSTPCVPFLMPSSMSCERAGLGATCQPTSRRGKPCSTISGACDSKALGRFYCGHSIALSVNDKEGTHTQVPPSWMLKASKRSRNRLESVAMMHTSTSKAENGTFSWIRLLHPHFHLRDPC